MTEYTKTENWKMLDDKSKSLIEFVYEYMNTHVYCSRKYLSGDYITKIYPYKPNNYKILQKQIKRKLGRLFSIFMNHGLVSRFNTSAIRVNESFKEMSLEDIFELTVKNT